MMMHLQIYLPIILAAAADMIVGMFWYSDHLFGSFFEKTNNKTTTTKNLIYYKIGMQTIASLVMAAALFVAISIFEKTQIISLQEGFIKFFSSFFKEATQHNNYIPAMKTAGFIWIGFLVPLKASCTIWGSKSWIKFAIKISGELVRLLTMAAIIAFI